MFLSTFDTSQKTFSDLIDFCENLEELEELEQQANTKKASTKKGGSKGKKRSAESDKGDKKYHCMLHGANNTHNTEDCSVMTNQAKKMRGMYNAQPTDRRAKYKQQQEIQAIVESSVARAIKGINKKRKGRTSSKKTRKSSRDEVNAFDNISVSGDSDDSKTSGNDSDSNDSDSVSSASTNAE